MTPSIDWDYLFTNPEYDNNILQQFRNALPRIKQWIYDLLDKNAERAHTVSALGFTRLHTCFSQELLESTKVVTLSQVSFPPLARFGLDKLGKFIQEISPVGITYKNTIFLQKDQATDEHLCFHEVVHIVQWGRLGIDCFLLAYAMGLLQCLYLQCEYEESPLERMAYELDSKFAEDEALPSELVRAIQIDTDNIWAPFSPDV